MKIPELLAPAGSLETLIAVSNAGADEVYAGGIKYGARAYAGNLTENELMWAIEYLHLHNKKLYLTLNTLIKNDELVELYDYLLPLYIKGLDGIIVQDIGVISYIRKQFPDLPVHVSTQASIFGIDALNFFYESGAKRAVLARELSLSEIEKIKKNTDIELEVFVHGALCYSYSGMCFYSSLIGGRSGNRGRCAQPCRMSYSVNGNEREWMSLKDLSLLEQLDKLCAIGVDSLKIEGRMKNTSYAVGVTKTYRKYLDLLKKNQSNFKVSSNDKEYLKSLYQRRGFDCGYLFRQNGKEMLISENRRKNKESDNNLTDTEVAPQKISVNFNAYFKMNEPALLMISDDNNVITAEGPICTKAQKKPLSKETVADKLSKVNDTLLSIDDLNIEIDKDLFVPLSALNELRRTAVDLYLSKREESFLRNKPDKLDLSFVDNFKEDNIKNSFSASFLSIEQGLVLSKNDFIKRIYFPLELIISEFNASVSLLKSFKTTGKQLYLSLPEVFRDRSKILLNKNLDSLIEYFDGFLIKNIDELFFIKKNYSKMNAVLDFTVYAFNNLTADYLKNYYSSLTAPIELNFNELKNLSFQPSEIVIYGRYPMMFSANCLIKNSNKCTKLNESLYFKDRMGMNFYVKSFCSGCYNVIYNSKVTSLLEDLDKIDTLSISSYRFSFTDETADDISNILKYFKNPKEFTKGHFIRGVQ